ncbi:hypothetical protein L596_021347 [Steinernema carpocapsae]|uniref:Uncharacterized protein n=1 Tax=Steinernema carpocapsae TaxID=34508 RepID=A0A4U5MII1_STECR|nr:hypothetical protein L596_021347 [Steinernema carpocapsae]
MEGWIYAVIFVPLILGIIVKIGVCYIICTRRRRRLAAQGQPTTIVVQQPRQCAPPSPFRHSRENIFTTTGEDYLTIPVRPPPYCQTA